MVYITALTILGGLLVFVVGYSVSEFLLKKVKGIEDVVNVLSIAIGVAVAFVFAGLIK